MLNNHLRVAILHRFCPFALRETILLLKLCPFACLDSIFLRKENPFAFREMEILLVNCRFALRELLSFKRKPVSRRAMWLSSGCIALLYLAK